MLGITTTIDAGAPSIKKRRRGLPLGGLMLAAAETMLAGGDFMCDLDNQRKDATGLALRAVSGVPASTTFIAIGKRFDATLRAHVERANATLVKKAFALLPAERRAELTQQRPTIDLGPTDTDVYGRKKEGSNYNYQGQRVYRPHPAVWAEPGWALATNFGSGRSDPRPQAAALLERALAALPEGLLRAIVRADSGFFDHNLAQSALSLGCDYAITVKRTDALRRSERKVPDHAWRRAKRMDAEMAECDYSSTGRPDGARVICRWVKVDACDLCTDPRSRRRRTIDPEQLSLLCAGHVAFAYAYSFVITNLDGDIVDIEAWFHRRARIEESTKDSKLGMALRHVPSGYEAVNAM